MKSMTQLRFWTSINRNTSINAKIVNETDLNKDIVQLIFEKSGQCEATALLVETGTSSKVSIKEGRLNNVSIIIESM